LDMSYPCAAKSATIASALRTAARQALVVNGSFGDVVHAARHAEPAGLTAG
jgi:hypothetical protein